MESKNKLPVVSIIVPTKNSELLMIDFLKSLKESEFKDFEVIINDDVSSTDNLDSLVKNYQSDLNVNLIKENISMAQGRISGAKHAKGRILLHLDSDMRASIKLLGECVDLLDSGYDALIIPEESYGETFWARVKWLEKKMYENEFWMQSLRVIKTDVYFKLGGHNPELVFSEDKDFDIRVRKAGYKVGKTKNFIRHYEGKLTLFKTISKKMNYSGTSDKFKELHPEHFKIQSNIFYRYFVFIKNIKYMFSNPVLYFGLFILKTAEYASAFIGILKKKML